MAELKIEEQINLKIKARMDSWIREFNKISTDMRSPCIPDSFRISEDCVRIGDHVIVNLVEKEDSFELSFSVNIHGDPHQVAMFVMIANMTQISLKLNCPFVIEEGKFFIVTPAQKDGELVWEKIGEQHV